MSTTPEGFLDPAEAASLEQACAAAVEAYGRTVAEALARARVVAVLDGWQRAVVGKNPRRSWHAWQDFSGGCTCELRAEDGLELHFTGPTPDAARAAARAIEAGEV